MISGLYKCFDHWSQQGTVWLYSDPHFGDKELAAGFPDRPSDADQIKMINSKVGRKDTLIILGDVGDIECARQLKGYKILVCGNHDVGHTKYAEVFNEVYSGALIIGEKLMLSHEPVDIPWIFNIHGHDHAGTPRANHLNCCADVIGYTPINMNQWVKSGAMAKVQTIHRETIDGATKRAKKRKKKKYVER